MIVQLLMTSVQCLWIYDYLLTFGDEVWCSWFLSIDVLVSNCYKGGLCLVWGEILE